MGEKGKLVVIDRIIGPPNQSSYALIVDLTVLVEHGGQERSQKEFETLFDQAGLKLSCNRNRILFSHNGGYRVTKGAL